MNKKRKIYNLCEHLQEIEAHLLQLGGFDPVLPTSNSFLTSPTLLSYFDGPFGSGHPDPDFSGSIFNTASTRAVALPVGEKTPCHGVPGQKPVDQSFLAVRTIWHGIWMKAAPYVANSILKRVPFLGLVFGLVPRAATGISRALQALRLHANDPITMYAQLLTRSSTGSPSAAPERRS